MALDTSVTQQAGPDEAPSRRRRRLPGGSGPRTGRGVATTVCWVLAAATVVPLVEVVYQSFRKQTGLLTSVFSLDSYRQLFTAQIFHSVGLSLEFGLGSAVIAVVVGGALAWLIVRTDIPWRRFFEIAALVPFFLSPFILAITWEYTGSPNTGLFNRALIAIGLTHSAVLNIYSTFGIILVIGMAHVPLAYLMISGSLRQMDPSLEQAARVSGAGPLRTGLQVTARLASPGVMSAFVIAFVLGFEDLGVPLVLGVPSGITPLSVRIWQTIQQTFPANYNFAAAASVFMVLIPAIAFWIQRRIVGRRTRYTVSGKSSAPQRMALGRAKWPAFILCLLWTLFAVVLPLVTLVLTAFQRRWTGSVNLGILTLSNFTAVFHNNSSALPVFGALTNSLLLSACTATFVIVCAVAVTYGTSRLRARGGRIADLILSMPLAVPGTTIAVGLLNLLLRTPLYGTIWIIGIAYAIRYFPYALRPVDAALTAVHPELEEASRVSGRGLIQTVRLVIFPLLRPAMISGWLILFVMFMREVAISNLLYLGGNSTLSVALRSLSSLEPDGVVAAFTLMQIVLFLLIAGLALLAGGSRRTALRLPT